MTMLSMSVHPAAHRSLERRCFQRLLAALEAHDLDTAAHSRRVSRLCLRVADGLELPRYERLMLERAALLHDIGKLDILTSLLRKPGKLSYDELLLMQTHSASGADRVASVFPELVPIVRAHHEAYNGWGYPDRLVGNDIPFLSRVIAVCDSWDAMVSKRVYKSGMGPSFARQVMQEGAGSQWDHNLVKLFMSVMPLA